MLWKPPVHGHIYVNRKGFHYINVQVICRVTHVLANYTGSTHDSFILATSGVPAAFLSIAPLDGWLLGDNGWPLHSWLIMPYIMPTPYNCQLNITLLSVRPVIEWTFGLFKNVLQMLGQVRWHITIQPSGSQCPLCAMLQCTQHWHGSWVAKHVRGHIRWGTAKGGRTTCTSNGGWQLGRPCALKEGPVRRAAVSLVTPFWSMVYSYQ